MLKKNKDLKFVVDFMAKEKGKYGAYKKSMKSSKKKKSKKSSKKKSKKSSKKKSKKMKGGAKKKSKKSSKKKQLLKLKRLMTVARLTASTVPLILRIIRVNWRMSKMMDT